MDDALTLEAPPTMFENLEAILRQNDCDLSLLSSNSVVRGIRRKDTSCYCLTHGCASVEIWAERRFGNPTMFISIFPTQKSIRYQDLSSNTLVKRIVELLVANGANSE